MADAVRRVSVRLSLDDAARVKAGLKDVGESGQKSLEQIRSGAETASRSLDLINTAVRGIQIAGLAAGIRAVVVAGDSLTQSMGRLTTAVGGVERASEVYAQLYRDSLRTGVAVSESVDAFQRFSIAAREIGATTDQVTALVGGLQRAAIVSGTAPQQVAAATQQLAQALASGVLQGDELRSVLENMPQLAQALARELGVSIGELRKLGSEGKLTADRVFPALLRATQAINAEFERAPLSVGRAWGQLNVAATEFLGRLDQAIGLSNTLARALSGAARGLDGLRRGAGLTNEVERLADLRRQAAELAAEIARLETAPLRVPRAGTLGQRETQEGRTARLAELRAQQTEINEELARIDREAAARRQTEETEAAGRAAAARRQRSTEAVQDLARQLDQRLRIEQEYQARLTTLQEGEASGAIEATERQRLATLALRDRDDALRRLAGPQARATAAVRENGSAERELNALLRERQQLIEQNETPYERYIRQLERIGDLADRAERSGNPVPTETISRAATAALEDLEEAEQRVAAAGERAGTAARQLGFAFSSAFEDAILDGEKLSKILQGLARDMARIVLRQTVTEPLGNAAGTAAASFGSSLFSGLSGLFRAEGGPVSAGQPYIVGEQGPEWFVPNRGGTVLPNGTAPSGTTVHTSINIDARGADAGVEARLRLLAGQIARQASAMTLDAVRRGGSAYETVRG